VVHREHSLLFHSFSLSLSVYLKMHVCEITKHVNFISIDNLRFCCRCDDLLVGSVSPRKLQIMRLHCWPAPQLPNGEYCKKHARGGQSGGGPFYSLANLLFRFIAGAPNWRNFARDESMCMCVCRRVCCVLMFIIFSVLGRHKISRYVPPRTPFCTAQFRVYIPDRRARENYKGDYCYLKKRRLLSCQPAEW
jgi:hypothetical protein